MTNLVRVSEIKRMIIELRGQRIILDRDMAILYGTSTRALIQAVKRNSGRFPQDFMFQLNDNERDFLVSQNVIPNLKYFGGRNPYAFTRNGANMLSAILKSSLAVQRSIQIMRAFSVIEEIMTRKRGAILSSSAVLDKLSTHSRAIMRLFQKDKAKIKEIRKVKRIIGEMINLLQQLVLRADPGPC